jgi:hypothetical protein
VLCRATPYCEPLWRAVAAYWVSCRRRERAAAADGGGRRRGRDENSVSFTYPSARSWPKVSPQSSIRKQSFMVTYRLWMRPKRGVVGRLPKSSTVLQMLRFASSTTEPVQGWHIMPAFRQCGSLLATHLSGSGDTAGSHAVFA